MNKRNKLILGISLGIVIASAIAVPITVVSLKKKNEDKDLTKDNNHKKIKIKYDRNGNKIGEFLVPDDNKNDQNNNNTGKKGTNSSIEEIIEYEGATYDDVFPEIKKPEVYNFINYENSEPKISKEIVYFIVNKIAKHVQVPLLKIDVEDNWADDDKTLKLVVKVKTKGNTLTRTYHFTVLNQ